MTTRSFRLFYLVAVMLCVSIAYASVSMKDLAPQILSDTQMRELVGQHYWTPECDPKHGCYGKNGCYNVLFGHASIKYTPQTTRWDCVSNPAATECDGSDRDTVCRVDNYDGSGCNSSQWQNGTNQQDHTSCDSTDD